MPVAASTGASAQTAFQHVRDNIDDLNGRAGAQDTDLIFLKGLMDSPVMSSLVKDRLKDKNGVVEPVGTGNVELAEEIEEQCRHSRNRDAQELARILRSPHLKALINAHDTVARKTMKQSNHEEKPAVTIAPSVQENGDLPEAIRLVGLRKNPDEPLGVTVRAENEDLVIARILGGGMIDRQGLLRVGDVIKEINGVEVHSPEQLQEQLKKAQGSVRLKVMPSFNEPPAVTPEASKKGKKKVQEASSPRTLRKLVASVNENLPSTPSFVKAHFGYDPKKDTLLPCPEIGLSFKQGDILQILNQQDPNWWQAKRVGCSGPAGLIPSQELEERRKAFVRPEFDYATKTSMCGTKVAKKKKKQMYITKQNAEFDKAELVLYEEVTRMPPFQRKTLVLIGAQGVGRRTLKNRLLGYDPERFGTTIPYTSRPPREGEDDGRGYFFTSREIMEADINENKYLEFGEYNGHLYGTKLDTVRAVIRSGKMCVLDCNPQALKLMNTPEFLPFVVLIASPGIEILRQIHDQKFGQGSRNLTFDRAVGGRQSRRARTLESLASLMEDEDLKRTQEESSRMQRAFDKYIDTIIINEDIDTTFENLLKAVKSLSTEPQWVPVSWVY